MSCSNFNYKLDQKDYTWENALLWGNFAGHCKKAGEGNLGDRIVHVLIAAVELLPIISQIISIFEKFIVSLCDQTTNVDEKKPPFKANTTSTHLVLATSAKKIVDERAAAKKAEEEKAAIKKAEKEEKAAIKKAVQEREAAIKAEKAAAKKAEEEAAKKVEKEEKALAKKTEQEKEAVKKAEKEATKKAEEEKALAKKVEKEKPTAGKKAELKSDLEKVIAEQEALDKAAALEKAAAIKAAEERVAVLRAEKEKAPAKKAEEEKAAPSKPSEPKQEVPTQEGPDLNDMQDPNGAFWKTHDIVIGKGDAEKLVIIEAKGGLVSGVMKNAKEKIKVIPKLLKMMEDNVTELKDGKIEAAHALKIAGIVRCLITKLTSGARNPTNVRFNELQRELSQLIAKK